MAGPAGVVVLVVRIVAVCPVIGAIVGAIRRAVVAMEMVAPMRAYFVASRRPAVVRLIFLYFVDDDASGGDTQQGFAKAGSSLNL